jgi:hypothetical protein
MTAWGLRSKGGIVTEAPNEIKARHWAGYDFKARIGDVGEYLVKQDEPGEWVEA